MSRKYRHKIWDAGAVTVDCDLKDLKGKKVCWKPRDLSWGKVVMLLGWRKGFKK